MAGEGDDVGEAGEVQDRHIPVRRAQQEEGARVVPGDLVDLNVSGGEGIVLLCLTECAP